MSRLDCLKNCLHEIDLPIKKAENFFCNNENVKVSAPYMYMPYGPFKIFTKLPW